MDIQSKINLVLAGWNPIGVTDGISLVEYKSYIPSILKVLDNGDEKLIVEHLIKLITDDMGLPFDRNNEGHIDDIANIASVLRLVYQG